jgi:hypothetical protein
MFKITIPDIMPVLSHGNHNSPAEGACFMEYTSLLAGEPFVDRPDCVDGEIATFMMWFNDSLPDADRHLLVPFLGRGIGLVTPRRPRPMPVAKWRKLSHDEQVKEDTRFDKRRDQWEERARKWRSEEVLPRLRETIGEVGSDHLNVGQGLINHFSEWTKATGNKLIETEDGYHEDCPGPCDHHLDPGHRAAVDKLLAMADALHTAYEEAMEARGWTIKRGIACDLPQVMEQIG